MPQTNSDAYQKNINEIMPMLNKFLIMPPKNVADVVLLLKELRSLQIKLRLLSIQKPEYEMLFKVLGEISSIVSNLCKQPNSHALFTPRASSLDEEYLEAQKETGRTFSYLGVEWQP